MKLTLLLSIGVAICLVACERNNSLSGYRFDRGTFPEIVSNLGDVNSVEDDYNSTVPAFGDVMPLVFSSKRGGRSDFNFVRESINYSFDRSSGKFSVDNKPYGGLDILQEQAPIGLAVNAANSSANELGPYMLSYDRDLIKDGYNRHYAEYFMLFASDRIGNLDIYLTHNFQQNPTGTSGSSSTNKPFVEPIRVPFLNSSADDAYPTFDKDFRTIYFTSNRAGSFDVYKASLPVLKPTELHTGLSVLADVPIERVAGLSSGADDKCPFILNDMLVFTSNRAGGFGGYDLYYSKWNGDGWSEPVNFGPSINTASDEYRPILTGTDSYTNQLMIFSSNRPGGKGGFDLYMVGVAK